MDRAPFANTDLMTTSVLFSHSSKFAGLPFPASAICWSRSSMARVESMPQQYRLVATPYPPIARTSIAGVMVAAPTRPENAARWRLKSLGRTCAWTLSVMA